MSRAVHALRIVKPPAGVGYTADEMAHYRPGLFCSDRLRAFRGVQLHKAEFYMWPLDAASCLAEAEKRHPGLELEIVCFVESTATNIADHEKVRTDVQAFIRDNTVIP